MPRVEGLTLLELLVALGIAAILLGVGAPALRDLHLDAQRTDAMNALVRALHLARTESLRNGQVVAVCPTGGDSRCTDDADTWARGWQVFVNTDNDQPARRDSDEIVLLDHGPTAGAQITSNRAAFQYRPFNRRSTNGTLVYCDDRGDQAARALIVSYTGRPRIASRDASGRALNCSG